MDAAEEVDAFDPFPLKGVGVVRLRARAGLNAVVRGIAGKPAPTSSALGAGGWK